MIVFIWLLLLANVRSEVWNTITLPQGRIMGRINVIDGYQYFLGIPYATVTERFRVASEPPEWNDVFRADNEVKCKQYSVETKSVVGTEDCLAANVYTPSDRSPELLPVIVFVHGGGFYKGSNAYSQYNPKFIVKKKTVVVTINYRLGAFGFLCLKNQGAQGNVGIKDIIAALTWTKNNIAHFGGNPDSITLWGQSSGAMAVSLILNQAKRGLFHKAIMDSGAIISPHLFDKNPIASASQVASRLGYSTIDTRELLSIFRNSSSDDIVKASYNDASNDALAPYVMLPCKEDAKISINPIITDDPHLLLNSANSLSNLSIIMGFNNKEGIFWTSNFDEEGLKDLDENFTNAIPKSIIFNSDKCKQSFKEAVRDLYFNGSSSSYSGLIDYFSDVLVMDPSVRTMKTFASNNQISLYAYYFKYDSLRNRYKLKTKLRNVPGASHSDELPYIFDDSEASHSDMDFVDIMSTLWSNFARTGIPSANSVTWTPSKDQLRLLQLDKTIQMINLPNQERHSFWKIADKMYGLQYP